MTRGRVDYELVKQLPLTYQAVIPEEYLDVMGHMNVMWYTHLFSLAMGGLFQRVGLAWDKLEEHHGGTFALESHVRFLSEIRVGDAIEVHSRVIARSEKRFQVMHFMTNQTKQDTSATLEAINAYIDMRKRRMASLPPGVMQKFDTLIAEHTHLPWSPPLCGVMTP